MAEAIPLVDLAMPNAQNESTSPDGTGVIPEKALAKLYAAYLERTRKDLIREKFSLTPFFPGQEAKSTKQKPLFPKAELRGSKYHYANETSKDELVVAAEGQIISLGLNKKTTPNIDRLIQMRHKRDIRLRGDIDKGNQKTLTSNRLLEAVFAQTVAEISSTGKSACASCRHPTNPGGIFQVCKSVDGMFDGACVNCYSQELEQSCSFRHREDDPRGKGTKRSRAHAAKQGSKKTKRAAGLSAREQPEQQDDDEGSEVDEDEVMFLSDGEYDRYTGDIKSQLKNMKEDFAKKMERLEGDLTSARRARTRQRRGQPGRARVKQAGPVRPEEGQGAEEQAAEAEGESEGARVESQGAEEVNRQARAETVSDDGSIGLHAWIEQTLQHRS